MKNLQSLLIFVIILLQINSGSACTCDVDWSFCETVDDSYHIAEVEVLTIYVDPHGDFEYMDIKITETLQNGIAEDSLTVETSYLFCHDLLLGQFSIGEKLIVNFAQISFDSTSIANHSSIDFFSCHTNFLRLNQNEVNGNITPTLSAQDYSTFKNNLTACNDFIASTDQFDFLKNNISISPNPFSENLIISLNEVNLSDISITVFSPAGEIIISKNDFQNSVFDLSINNFPKGVYFIRVRYGESWLVKKVVKM